MVYIVQKRNGINPAFPSCLRSQPPILQQTHFPKSPGLSKSQLLQKMNRLLKLILSSSLLQKPRPIRNKLILLPTFSKMAAHNPKLMTKLDWTLTLYNKFKAIWMCLTRGVAQVLSPSNSNLKGCGFEFPKEQKGSNKENGGNDFIKKENGKSDRNALPKESVSKKEKLTISSIDFVGLVFSDDKKSRGLPAGLVPTVDPFAGGDLPDIEILVGDTSKFADTETSKSNRIQEDDMNTYKQKVSTWGVFPRPNDISKTFGGGRTIRPGEVLESAEQKAAKEARTRELLAAYKRRVGLTIDPNLKLECEKALKDGDSFMDIGELKEALPFYEKVMNKLPFQK